MKTMSMYTLSSVSVLLLCLWPSAGAGLLAQYAADQIFQFGNSSFVDIENVAIRENGSLLLDIITSPTIYTLDPTAKNPTAQLLHTFSNATSCLGITETSPDVFAVVVGNVTVAKKTGVPGTFSIWQIDLNPSTPAVKMIAAIPQAKLLNGMTHVQEYPNVVLISDSEAGVIFSVNVDTGTVETAISDSALGNTTSFPIGVNGIRTTKDKLYFANSALGIFGYYPINNRGQNIGPAVIVANISLPSVYDDFAVDRHGDAWITTHSNSLVHVSRGGQQKVVLNSTGIVQPTSAVLGKGGCTLYVVTAGQEKNATSIISGQVFEIGIC